MSETVLFLTGHMAYDNLCRQLQEMNDLDFNFRVHNIGVKVAALMSSSIVSRRLHNLDGISRVILPGLYSGSLAQLSEQFGVEFERGPKDLRDLPEHFGSKTQQKLLNEQCVDIFAEIVDAAHLSIEDIVRRAESYRSDGADVIDLGCLPDVEFAHLADAVVALKDQNFKVSVDSLDSKELITGGQAGADYLLSLTENTAWVADEVDSIPVLIPKDVEQPESLYRVIEHMSVRGKPFIADPILEPFPYGFTASLVRYHSLRQRYPDCKLLMGTGNVTELMDADTAGITALLMALLTELNVSAILTTQVSSHACRAVREAELARRIMHTAKTQNQLPKRYDSGLLCLHDKNPFPYTASEISQGATAVRDPSYRIQVSESGIHLYNRDGLQTGCDPFEFQSGIDVGENMSHMFYLGVELSRAQIAWQLGKRYLQDNPLDWGVARRDLPPVEKQKTTDAE